MADLREKYALTPDMMMTGEGMPLQTNEQLGTFLNELHGQGQGATHHPAFDGPMDTSKLFDVSQDTNYELSGDTEMGDYTKGLGKGFVDILASVLGTLELTGAVEAGTLTKGVEQYAAEITQNMSPSARENMQRRWTDMGEDGVLRNPKAILQQLTTVAPSLAMSFGGAGIGARIAAKGLTGAARTAAAAKGGAIGGAVTEPLQIAGATLNELRGAMEQLGHDELLQNSKEYQRAYNKWGSEAEARQEVLMKASRSTAVLNASLGSLIALGPGAAYGKLTQGAREGYGAATTGLKGRAQRGLRTGAIEGSEELAQEVTAGVLTGISQQQNIDARHDPYDDLLERGVAGAALGFGTGAPIGVLTGPRNTDVPPEVGAAVDSAIPFVGPPEVVEPTPFESRFVEPTAFDPMQPPAPDMLPILPQDVGPTTGPRQRDRGPDLPTGPQVGMPPPSGTQGELFPGGTGQGGNLSQPQDTPFSPVGNAVLDPSEPPAPSRHVPESIDDLQAQIMQMLDPDTNKNAVYIDPVDFDNPEYKRRMEQLLDQLAGLDQSADLRELYPDFAMGLDQHGGVVITRDRAHLEAYTAAGETEAARAKLLNYTQSKDELANPDQTMTVAKVNENGTVAESQVVDLDGVEMAELAYYQDLKKGQRVVAVPTGEALNARLASTEYQPELPDMDVAQPAATYRDLPLSEAVDATFTNDMPATYSGVETGRTVDGRREGLKQPIEPGVGGPDRRSEVGTEQERLDRALQRGPRDRVLEADKEDARVAAKLEEVLEEELNPEDSARATRLYKQLKSIYGDYLKADGAQNRGVEQGDLFAGANTLLANTTEEQFNEIGDLLDAAAAVNKPGKGGRTAVMEEINTILGGAENLGSVEKAVLAHGAPGQLDATQETPTAREKQQAAQAEKQLEDQQTKRNEQADTRRRWASREQARAQKAKRQKKASKPIKEGAKALVAEARELENRQLTEQEELPVTRRQRAPTVEELPEQSLEREEKYKAEQAKAKSKAKADKKKGWAKRKKALGGQPNIPREQALLKVIAKVNASMRDALVNKFGVSKRIAKQFTLTARDIQSSVPLGKKEFEAFLSKLSAADLVDDWDAHMATLATMLERQVLDKLAQRIVQSDLKMRAGPAIEKVARWRKNPNTESFPDATAAKLRELYEGEPDAAYTALTTEQEAELEALTAESEKDSKGKIDHSEKVDLEDDNFFGGTATTAGEGLLEGVGLKDDTADTLPTGEVVDEAYVPPIPDKKRTSRGKSENKGTKGTTSRREKTQQEKDLDALAKAAAEDVPAPSTGVDGSDIDDRPAGERPVARDVIVPDQGTPEPLAKEFFEEFYPRLRLEQRAGVNTMWQRILDNPAGAAAILGDGTGLGKTTESLVLMDIYRRMNPDSRILLVAPKPAIFKQFENDAAKLGIGMEGIDTSTYAKLGEVQGDYDLVVYDEAQKIAKAANKWSGIHDEINAKHTVYVTATPGDTPANLALVAAADGKTLPELIASVSDENVVIDDVGIDMDSVTDQRKFLQGLADVVTRLRNAYGYIRREYPRTSTMEADIVEDYGDLKLKLDDGSEMTPLQVEEQLLRTYGRDDPGLGSKGQQLKHNEGTLWNVSTKLAELAKLQHTENRIVDAIENRRQPIALFYSHQEKNTPIELGDGRTVIIPSAINLLNERLEQKYPGMVLKVTGGQHNVAASIDKFQDGGGYILLSTYQSVGEGLNLDATVPVEEGGWGRELLLVSDDWSPDQIDQAHGRVERANTRITPVVRRVTANKFQGEIARDEKVQLKAQQQAVLRGEGLDSMYDMDRNIAVTTLPDGYVGVRIKGMRPSNPIAKSIQKVLEGKRSRYRKSTREHLIPADAWDAATQKLIRDMLATGNVSTVETKTKPKPKAEAAKAKSKSKAKTKVEPAKEPKPTKETVKDDKVDLDALPMEKLAELEEQLTTALDKASGDMYVELDAALNAVYAAMERKSTAGDFESLGSMSVEGLRPNVVARLLGTGHDTAWNMLTRMANTAGGMTRGQRKFLRNVASVIGDTQVRMVDDLESVGHGNAAGLYRSRNDTITLRADELNAETFIHEVLHAVMHHAIKTKPEVAAAIEDMRKRAAIAAQSWEAFDRLSPDEKAWLEKALGDNDEFVSYGLTNPSVIELLDSASEVDHRSLLQKVIDTILSWVGMGKSRADRTLSDSLTDLVMRHASRKRSNSSDEFERVIGAVGEKTARGLKPLTEAFKRTNQPQTFGELRAAIRRKTLGFSTLRQIESVFAPLLDRLPEGNPVKKWLSAMHMKEVEQKKYSTLVNDMHRRYSEAVTKEDGKFRDAIETLFGESTLWGIWPDRAFNAEGNKHLPDNAANRQKHAELRALYNADPAVSSIFNEMAKFYADEKTQNFDLRVKNILYGFELTGATVKYEEEGKPTLTIDSDQMRDKIARDLRSKSPAYSVENFRVYTKTADGEAVVDDTVTGLLQDAVRNDKAATLQNGPYFPLKRFGEWVVTAEKNRKTWTATLTPDEIAKAEKKAEKKIGKKREDWHDYEARRYAELVQANKRQALRKKLNEQHKVERESDQGIEAETVEFDGDTARVQTVQRWVSMHESEAKAKAENALLAKEKWTVPSLVTRKVSTATSNAAVNSAIVGHLRGKLGLRDGENHPLVTALEASIIDMMPETAMQKSMLKRKGILGYNKDHGRALAAHGQSASWYRATLLHGKAIGQGVAAITEAEKTLHEQGEKYVQDKATAVGDALREVRNHINLDSNNDTLNPIVRATGEIGFLWLLVSPAYLMVNLTQPIMYTLPWLKARQGEKGMRAWKAFRNAHAIITPEITKRAGAAMKQGATKYDIDPELFDFLERGNNGEAVLSERIAGQINDAAQGPDARLTPERARGMIKMLEELSENNVLDMTLAMDTTAAAQGRSQQNLHTRTMDVARILPHLTEVMNRSVTAMAAYEMGLSQKMSHDAAVEFATQAVVETQFDYTLLNKPRYMSERYYQLAKPIFMFMQHPQHVYGLFVQAALRGGQYGKLVRNKEFDENNPEHIALRKDWRARRDTVIGVLGTHLLVGGVAGAMFEPTKWALGLALAVSEAISGEPPEETDVYIRRWTASMFGEGMGRVVSDGLPEALGLHLGGNMGLSSLALMKSPSRFGGGREGVEEMFFSAMGPVPNLVANVAQGIQDIKEGDTLNGLARMMPRVAREPLRAVSLAGDGLRDSNGHAIVNSKDFSPLELFYATMGLQSTKKSMAYERKGELDNLKQYHRQRRKRLTERLYRARGDGAKTQQVIRDIDAYNATLPWGSKMSNRISSNKREAEKTLQELGSVLTTNERYLAENR